MPPLIFDLDGTLADTLPGIQRSAQAALQQIQPHRTLPDLRPHIGPPIRQIFRHAIPEEDPEILDQLETAFRHHYDTQGWKLTRPYPRALQTLRALHALGHPCHLLTNKPATPTRTILHHLRLHPHLHHIITPDTHTPTFPTKAHAALHLRALLPPAPRPPILIGDSLDDAHAAHTAGFTFIAATYGYGAAHTQTQHPIHHHLPHLRHLPALLNPR